VFQGKFHMESQALKTRYCDKAVLSALLTELFGRNLLDLVSGRAKYGIE